MQRNTRIGSKSILVSSCIPMSIDAKGMQCNALCIVITECRIVNRPLQSVYVQACRHPLFLMLSDKTKWDVLGKYFRVM